ncbi:MAG TPA: hypothetical protein VMB03_23835 [Bryobacteraceae bacterium]|nr:hypothetical protein [Bryobacteraceae bacterium]
MTQEALLETLARLQTRQARAVLENAMAEGGILAPAASGSLGGSLHKRIAEQPAKQFENPAFRAAFKAQLKNLEADLADCRRINRILLGLFVICALATLWFIYAGIQAHHPASDLKQYIGLVPTAGVGAWAFRNSATAKALRSDLKALTALVQT